MSNSRLLSAPRRRERNLRNQVGRNVATAHLSAILDTICDTDISKFDEAKLREFIGFLKDKANAGLMDAKAR